MMEREERLRRIEEMLKSAQEPISGAALAEELGVSRQAIVQDMAILRNRGLSIRSTPRGYLFERERASKVRRILAVRHRKEEVYDELVTIVNLGGRVLDVIVDHPIYGEIRGNIEVSTKEEVARFVNILESSNTEPLLQLSKGFHLHTVEADDEETLSAIEKALQEKGYLSWSTV